MPQDAVTADPKHYKVEFEDDQVRVLRIKYGPGEKSAMHGHPRSLGVFLTDVDGRFTFPDGSTEEIHGKAGDFVPFPETEHLPENLSDRPMELIFMEFKR